MIILSNCLTKTVDEGCLKLANSLVDRIKKNSDQTYVISFERDCDKSDIHLQLNKFHISRKLVSIIKKKRQPLLYIPFPAPSFSMVLRIWLISLFSRHGFRVVMTRRYPMNRLSKILLKMSKAELVVFSKEAKDFYGSIVKNRVLYIKTGIDTERYVPVSANEKNSLKLKYGLDPNKPTVLHVGHMKRGRNVAELLKINEKYQVLLVISTMSKERQDGELREILSSSGKIRIIDEYLPQIEEIYQMSDVYFFPVVEKGHCIDVPLSCLEAAACNKPVVTTDYGEMKEFIGKDGFYFIDSFDSDYLNETIEKALNNGDINIREQILEYDWKLAIEKLEFN